MPSDHIRVREGLTLTNSPKGREAAIAARNKKAAAAFMAYREKKAKEGKEPPKT